MIPTTLVRETLAYRDENLPRGDPRPLLTSPRHAVFFQPGNTPLKVHDPKIYDIIELEKKRQWMSLELIASENFTSQAVMECLGSALTNKYAEGLPGARYYGGNEHIDKVRSSYQPPALSYFSPYLHALLSVVILPPFGVD